MAKLIITKGLPGSGKSFWAEQQVGFKVVTKDDIRRDLEATGWKWSHANEKVVIASQEQFITTCLTYGTSVIAADTNFGKHEGRLRQLAEECGAEFEVKDFTDVPLQQCLERNRSRTGKARLPDDVIIQMYRNNIDPKYDPNPKPIPVRVNNDLPRAVICDLDGTLCLHNGRSPFDYEKCDTDLVNWPVMTLLQAMSEQGYEVIFMSGRENKARTKTLNWLAEHGDWQGDEEKDIPLFMRQTGDYRKDNIVKLEMFDTFIRDKWNVVFVLDDRDQVVKMWRELGLTCLQVNYGNF